MSIKILTKNSIDNTNIDGARANHFSAGMRSGIVKGAYNEGRLFTPASNKIALDSCELRISGHQVIIDSVEQIELQNAPSQPTRMSVIAEIKVDDSSVPTFRLFVQNQNVSLIQDNLFKTNNGNGTYQLRIGNFTLGTNGIISDVVRTADIITGGAGGGVADIKFNATATQLSSSSKPDVNIDYNEETGEYDAHFGIPAGSGSRVTIGGVEQPTWSADPVYQLSNPNLLINGDFRVNQRGKTSYTGTGNHYTVDRWIANRSTTIVDVNNDSITISGTIKDDGIQYRFEELDLKKIRGKTVTLSSKIKNITGKVTFWLRSYITWGTVIKTRDVSSTGIATLTVNVPSDLNALVVYIDFAGSSSTSNNVELEWVKLEVGSIATPFSPRPYAEELARCQRYYQKIFLQGNAGSASSQDAVSLGIPLVATMRTSPTLRIDTQPTLRGNGQTNIPVTLNINQLRDNQIVINFITTTSLAVNYAYSVVNGVIFLDAELY